MNFGKFGFWLVIGSIVLLLLSLILDLEFLVYPAILLIIIGFIFSIISLFIKKQNPNESKVLSIIGLILSLLLALFFVFLVLGSCLDCGVNKYYVDPNFSTNNILKDCSINPYSLYLNTIRFSDKYNILNKKEIIKNLKFNQNLFLYTSPNLTNFSLDNDIIKYLGKSTINVIAAAECGEDKNTILSLGLNQYVSSLDGVDGEFNCYLVIYPQK